MKSDTLSVDKIIVSDLFRGAYDHEKRLAEQEILYERLSEYNFQKEHRADPVIAEIAAILKDLSGNRIASIVFFESIIDKLKKHGIEVI